MYWFIMVYFEEESEKSIENTIGGDLNNYII